MQGNLAGYAEEGARGETGRRNGREQAVGGGGCSKWQELGGENFAGRRKAGESGAGAWYAGSEKRALAGLCRERASV